MQRYHEIKPYLDMGRYQIEAECLARQVVSVKAHKCMSVEDWGRARMAFCALLDFAPTAWVLDFSQLHLGERHQPLAEVLRGTDLQAVAPEPMALVVRSEDFDTWRDHLRGLSALGLQRTVFKARQLSAAQSWAIDRALEWREVNDEAQPSAPVPL